MPQRSPISLRMFLFAALMVLSTLFTPLVHAQAGKQSEPLFKTISALDAKLFDACNHCDLWKATRVVSYEHNHEWLAT